jgi:NAD(P)-dependent dehydrogenase (short-subunit alcohol dehydrogenase family)
MQRAAGIFCIYFSMKKSSAYAVSAASAALVLAALRSLSQPDRIGAGQVALITGGSRGLGLALAHRFGRAGCKLVLAARGEDELEVARDGLLRSGDVHDEDDVLLVGCDLTDQAQAAGAVAAAINTFGRIDIVINNAGIIDVGPFEDQPLAHYEKTMKINFFAALYTIQAAVPSMLERGSGSIVNISSIGGKIPVPHMLPYVAAKFALAGFSEGLHAELRHKGVRVTTVCPGLLRSGGEAHAKFTGNVQAEKAWFDWSAKTPGVAVSVQYAANQIFAAANRGRAEIVISPQAWLGARVFGLAPETTLWAESMINRYVLPAATGTTPDPTPMEEQENETKSHTDGDTTQENGHDASHAHDPDGLPEIANDGAVTDPSPS